jgi:hypothetical protein
MALEPGALTDAIEAAYETEWPKVKSNPLPDAGKEDRRLLFAGVARGILQYLSDHRDELLTSITTVDESQQQITVQVTGLGLGIST